MVNKKRRRSLGST